MQVSYAYRALFQPTTTTAAARGARRKAIIIGAVCCHAAYNATDVFTSRTPQIYRSYCVRCRANRPWGCSRMMWCSLSSPSEYTRSIPCAADNLEEIYVYGIWYGTDTVNSQWVLQIQECVSNKTAHWVRREHAEAIKFNPKLCYFKENHIKHF